MAQITLYLDEATQTLVEQASLASGLSKSRWVAEMIQRYAHHEWPVECLELAGKFPDFPLCDDLNLPPPAADAPRIGF
jgi:hypothetical protein